MNAQGIEILDCLQAVGAERDRRSRDAALAAAVQAVKTYQHARFTRTYADLLDSPRYVGAARFFLDELYGPKDFGPRDRQFARIVPGLVKLFPNELVETVRTLARLHALSERLDTGMGIALLGCTTVELAGYARAWRSASTPPERERQIALMLEVGFALDRYTRNPLLRHSLRMMRGPAQVAGVGILQAFLERGFETFRQLRGASDFLQTIATRERTLAAQLFAAEEQSSRFGAGQDWGTVTDTAGAAHAPVATAPAGGPGGATVAPGTVSSSSSSSSSAASASVGFGVTGAVSRENASVPQRPLPPI